MHLRRRLHPQVQVRRNHLRAWRQGSNSGGDYTSDEKRMQAKYKANVRHAKGLIAKGDSMMKGANGNTNHKDYKKGKLFQRDRREIIG